MKVVAIIPHRVWVNKVNGRQASLYGSVPYTSEADKPNWEVQTRGWTWETDDGKIGLCRVPAKTYDEAVEVMNRVNNC